MATVPHSTPDKDAPPGEEQSIKERQLRHDRYLMFWIGVGLLAIISLMLWLASSTNLPADFQPNVMPMY